MSSKTTFCIESTKKILSINYPSQINWEKIKQDLKDIDYFEFRLDYFSSIDHNLAIYLRQLKPWILKSLDTKTIYSNLSENPSFIDLDFFSQLNIFFDFYGKYQIILSAHVCADLNEVKNIYQKMLNYKASIYKLVVTPKNQIECLKITKFFREKKEKNFVKFCMGEDFSYTRYFSLIDKQPFIYIGVDDQLTALGQITLREIKNYQINYNYPKLLCLIGDPVSKSVSDVVYNFYFKKRNISAIYLKIKIKEDEFNEAIVLLKRLGFSGISVTTPLKFKASIYNIEDQFIPCNTLLLDDKILGFNTDNQALINLLEKKFNLENSKILILGCGPLAISFIEALIKKKAQVYVKNRTKEKIQLLKEKLPINDFNKDHNNFCAIIQATSKEFFDNQKNEEDLLNAKVYLESVNSPIFTKFTKKCLLEDKFIYFGFELFLQQGFLQLKYYLKNELLDDFLFTVRGLTIKELQRKC